jgi:hypothetical protein
MAANDKVDKLVGVRKTLDKLAREIEKLRKKLAPRKAKGKARRGK